MAQNDKVKVEESKPATVPIPSISGVEKDLQKVISNLIERVMILEAKTCNMPLHKPVVLPQKENYNTDFVAGM